MLSNARENKIMPINEINEIIVTKERETKRPLLLKFPAATVKKKLANSKNSRPAPNRNLNDGTLTRLHFGVDF